MPESTCLHIQDRESGPIRVVELPWISVRIGRAAFCEVRLPDQELAAEACRLTRRGRTWSLAPVGDQGLVVLDGRKINSPCPLPFGMPFQIGSFCLTLWQDLGAEPDWEMYPASTPPRYSAPVAPPTPSYQEPGQHDHHRAARVPTSGPKTADPASRTARDRTRWDARWKAAEAHLKSRAEGLRGGGEAQAGPSPSTYDPMPPRERPVAVTRPAGGATPLIDPVARPIPTPRAPMIEPGWSRPRSDAPLVSPRVEPSVRPVPTAAVERPGPAWTGPDVPLGSPAPSRSEWNTLERPADAELSPSARLQFAESGEPIGDRHDLESSRLAPVPTPGGIGNDSLRILEADWTESIDLGLISTSDVLLHQVHARIAHTRDQERQTPPAVPDPIENRHGLPETRQGPGPIVESPESPAQTDDSDAPAPLPPERDEEVGVVPPQVTIARDTAAVDGPPPIAASRDKGSVPAEPPQVNDRKATSTKEDQSQSLRDDRVRTASPITPSWERIDESSRLPGREPKKRRAGRDRVGPERRGKVPRATRPGDRGSASDSRRDTATPTADEVNWPSVKDILPNHGASLARRPTVSWERKSDQPSPTLPREPGQWLLPVWLAWPPIAVSVLVMGVGACVLSWIWAVDSSSAAIVTQRLLRPDVSSRRKSLPDWVVPPAGGWMTTTSQHVAHWAVLLGGVEGDGKRPVHDVSAMLTRSLQIAPLNPTAKLALARLETPQRGIAARPVGSLGLSRDAVSLAWSAGRLLDAGKKEAAIRLYGRALTAASTGGFSRTVTPRYDDDENSRRYLLPGEDAVRDIVNEMAARERDWTFREWSRALPQNPTVLLATARLLREKRRAEAEALLSLVIEGGGPSSTGHSADPRAVAARAEALALGSRLKEAEQEYKQAIELADNDMIRRSWWFNLADIALRLDDETQRLVAIRAAIAVVPSDEITRRASLLQRASDSRPRGRFGSAN